MTKQNKRNSNKRNNGRAVGGMRPPQFQANPSKTLRLRFTGTGAVGSSVTPLNITAIMLLNAAGIMQTSSTTAYPLYQCVRLKSVEIWTPYLGGTAPATCGVIFPTSSTYASNKEYNDLSISTAAPARVLAKPSKDTLNADWSTATTNQIFGVYGSYSGTSSGTVIIDVIAEFLQQDGAAGAVITISGGVAGTVTYQPLDGDGGVLPPVGKSISA